MALGVVWGVKPLAKDQQGFKFKNVDGVDTCFN